MKLSTFLAAAAVIGGSLLTPNTAKAAGCYPSLAYNVMKNVLDGGGTWQQAWEASAQERYHDGSELCTLQIKGKWKQYHGTTFNKPLASTIRECDERTDLIFYRRYPGLRGQKLVSMKGPLAKEWMAIRDSVC